MSHAVGWDHDELEFETAGVETLVRLAGVAPLEPEHALDA